MLKREMISRRQVSVVSETRLDYARNWYGEILTDIVTIKQVGDYGMVISINEPLKHACVADNVIEGLLRNLLSDRHSSLVTDKAAATQQADDRSLGVRIAGQWDASEALSAMEQARRKPGEAYEGALASRAPTCKM